jgi:hypothetical protein
MSSTNDRSFVSVKSSDLRMLLKGFMFLLLASLLGWLINQLLQLGCFNMITLIASTGCSSNAIEKQGGNETLRAIFASSQF